jgi:delta24-sterol reductase
MIVPAKRYVEVEYIPVHSLDEAISVFQSQTMRENGNEFVEGIMFGLDKSVIMVGKMTNEAMAGKVNSIGLWYKPWFYKHAESFLKKPSSGEYIEYIPLRQYLHRHTKSGFWTTCIGFPFGNNVIFRWFLGWLFPVRAPFLMLAPMPILLKRKFDDVQIIQDFVIPLEKMKEFLVLAHTETNLDVKWLCPCKIFPCPGFLDLKTGKEEMYVDVGLFGLTHVKGYSHERTIKKTRGKGH